MDKLVARFAPHFEEPLFRYRELPGGPDAEPLPLVAFAVDVPAQLDRNAQEGRLSIKLEFHIEDDPALFPEGESVSGQFFALREDFRAILPRLPYQLALKLMTLVAPPVGIDTPREDAVPRQLYDLDALLAQLHSQEQWDTLASYTARRYVKEERQRDREPHPDGAWPSIADRLDEWAQAEDPERRFGQLINSFQTSQVARATKRPLAQWRGRARRLQFAARCLAMGAEGFARWHRALEIESRIDEPAGRNLRAYRTALSEVVGTPARQLGQFPRVVVWEHLAMAEEIDAALDALDEGLAAAAAAE
jgi:hypothetical protein